jgi:hypothetical protein
LISIFFFIFFRRRLSLDKIVKDGIAFDRTGLSIDAAPHDDIKEDEKKTDPEQPFPFIDDDT